MIVLKMLILQLPTTPLLLYWIGSISDTHGWSKALLQRWPNSSLYIFFQKGGGKYPRYKQNAIKEVKETSVFVILYAQNTLEINSSITPCRTESFQLITYVKQNRMKQIKNKPQKPLFSFSTHENSLLKDCFYYKKYYPLCRENDPGSCYLTPHYMRQLLLKFKKIQPSCTAFLLLLLLFF